MNRNPDTKLFSLFLLVLSTLILPRRLPAQGTFVYTNDNRHQTWNSVTGFSVGDNGALTFLNRFPTGGEGWGSIYDGDRVAVSPVGDFLYAGDGGSNDVAVFAIDPATGNLTSVPGSPFTTANGGGGDISVAVTPDNKFLFASVDNYYAITTFGIANDGSLTVLGGSPFYTDGPPDGMKVSPDGKFLAVALEWPFSDYGAIDMFSVGADGSLTPVSGSPFWAYGPVGSVDINCASNTLFSGEGTGNGMLVEADSIASDGSLSPVAGSPFVFYSGTNSADLVLSPDDQLLFVSNQFSDSVTALAVASGGSLSLVTGSPFAAGTGGDPCGLATNQAGTFLYTASSASVVAGFSIAAGGSLTTVPGSPFSIEIGGNLYALAVFPPKLCPPTATTNATSAAFGNQLLNATSASQSVTLTDTSPGSTLNITSLNLSGTNASDFALTSPAGACPASGTLNAGASCTINVTFTPSATGSRSASLTIVSNAQVPVSPITLTGKGVSPIAALAPASLDFASLPVGTASATQTLTLSNTGTAALTISSIATTGDYNQMNNCGSSVNAGANCAIGVSFRSTAIGTRSGTLTVTDNSGAEPGSTQITSLTGTGLAPGAALTPLSLNFSGQNIETASAGQTLTLSNTGNAALTLTSVAVTGDYLETSNCGTSLAAGASCAIVVTFKPTATGSRTGTLTVTDNSFSGSIQTASLTGTGLGSAVALSPVSLSFGNQFIDSSSAGENITLTNTGNAALSLTRVTVTADYGQTNNCGATVPAGSSCAITVTFKPSATGLRAGTLTVTDNAFSDATQTINLSGTGVAPVAGLSPATLSFGNQDLSTSSAAEALTLTNTGTAALTITGVTASGDFTGTNTCGGSLAAGASCTISVIFKPAAAGVRSGTVTVTDNSNAIAGTIQTASLTGTGMGPWATTSVPALSFPAQMAATSSSAQAFMLTNTGNMTLTITGYAMSGAAAGDFIETHTCSSQLAPGASCTISVGFDPATGGMRSAVLVITDNSPTSPHDIKLSGMGEDYALSVTPSVTIPAGRKAIYDLWITPQGGFNQTVSVTCAGAPPEAACTVWPAAIRSWNGETAVAVSIGVSTTARPAITAPRPPSGTPPSYPFSVPAPLDPAVGRILCLVVIGLAALGFGARRRKWAPTLGLTALVLALSAMMWISCGSSAMNRIPTLTTPAGTPAGRYTLTLTTTSANLTHTVSATLIVQ